MKLSICTPTYNRAHYLQRIYESLKCQTCYDFEWIVVDDGSTDNTETVISNFIKQENPFNIIYLHKDNGGKHTALNYGVNHANGDLFLIVDSDDYLKNNAVEVILSKTKDLSHEFAGIGFNKLFTDGKIVGSTFVGDFVDCTSLERVKYNINGDKAEVFFTSILKKYPFPVFENERFLPEAVVWNRIANAGLKIRWYNLGIYYCEYQEDGLSMNTNVYSNFNGYTLYIKELNSYKQTALSEKIKNIGVYSYHAKILKVRNLDICKNIKTNLFVLFISRTLYSIKVRFFKNKRRKKLNI